MNSIKPNKHTYLIGTWEGVEYCAQCGKNVESAYGSNEAIEL